MGGRWTAQLSLPQNGSSCNSPVNIILFRQCPALYSNSRAYDEEQAADLDRLRNWVRLMGLTMYGDPDDPQTVPLHASGHAPGQALAEFVQAVRPGMLIPVHTENPGWWERRLEGTGIAVRPPLLATGMAIS